MPLKWPYKCGFVIFHFCSAARQHCLTNVLLCKLVCDQVSVWQYPYETTNRVYKMILIGIILHENNKICKEFQSLAVLGQENNILKKKLVCDIPWKWTSWLRPPKKSGSLHIMIFRYCGNILISVQSNFEIEKGVEKFMFGCHTLTHSTTLRRLPQVTSDDWRVTSE